ncbi:6-bladed beta-propeller [Prosthecobacter sp.]|uniref:6-bladed beta-propeller n=1 Tax=Prosthecobacter sp. TaxID=1965333 RepID=UPI003783203A
MSNRILSLLSVMALAGSAAAADVAYEFAPNFITAPTGKENIGNCHGEIAVDSAGNVYVSVQDANAGIQVYGKDGKFIKTLPLPPSLHGFVIRKDEGKEYIFAAVLGENRFIKCDLDGKVVLEIPKTAFPADKGALKLTNCDVASNGDIYIVDGYGKSWIFVFDRAGKFKTVFGGPEAPWNFKNTHKIFIDHRYTPERIVALDRGNNRMLHLGLDGTIIGTIASSPGLAKGAPPPPHAVRNPSSASFHGDLMCVAEIAGRVSVWDKDNKLVAELGVNPNFTNTPGIEPKDWQQGVVTSPHGITFDNDGNILEAEWNKWGRVLKWNVKK